MRDLMALWVVRFSMTAVTDYVCTVHTMIPWLPAFETEVTNNFSSCIIRVCWAMAVVSQPRLVTSFFSRDRYQHRLTSSAGNMWVQNLLYGNC